MTRAPRNPRRAYDRDGREIPPMTLANMREHGVRTIWASCQEAFCGRACQSCPRLCPGWCARLLP